MATLTKTTQTSYLNKDFAGFKRDLMKFSQAHHSGVFQDFNETSPGMAILELQAYVGDVLSYYQDMQFNEIKQETAVQIENVVSFAKQLGYRPQGKRAAQGIESFFIEVPATTLNDTIVPDDRYSPILRKGAQCQGPGGTTFETLDDIDFATSSPDNLRFVTGSQFDQTTGLPTYFALRKDVGIIAGKTVTDTFTVSDFKQFLNLSLSNPDVIEVISVFDSDGNEWIEVDYLAQDAVFGQEVNLDPSDNDVVPYVLKFTTVPRRFVLDRDPISNTTSLIFGSGDGQNFDDDLIPNLADLALPLAGRSTFTSFAIDPQNFLKTRSLGLSPYNTTLTVSYRIGGGTETNVKAGSISTVSNSVLDFSSTSLDVSLKGGVESSLECRNSSTTAGGAPEESISEIKANSAAFFAAQNRAVTREDYIARVLSIPSRFGKPDKVYVKRNSMNPLGIDIHVLSKDPDGHLTLATPTLKNNIKTYLTPFRMMSDGVNILDSTIINLRLNFGIVVAPDANKTETLTNCLSLLVDYFNIDKTNPASPIVVSDIASEIQQIQGVVSVYELTFTNVMGNATLLGSQLTLPYSRTSFDVAHNRTNEIIYCPQDAVFEIRYPAVDITGTAK